MVELELNPYDPPPAEDALPEPQADVRLTDVLIVGGGISGLSLATWLLRRGVDVQVLDKSLRPGGVIGTMRHGDFLFERGPNTILDKYPSLEELVLQAGLERELIRVPLRRQSRHVWLGGRMNAVPTSPLAFLRTPLLGGAAKRALLREPFVPPVLADETVADFVTRRLGPQWLRNLITPMVGGVWAGDPARLSTQYAFPAMKEMEREGGSLLKGAVLRMRRKARERRAETDPLRREHRRGRNMLSFREGLQVLPEALAGKLRGRYHSHVSLLGMRPRTADDVAAALRHGAATEGARLLRASDPQSTTPPGFAVECEHEGRRITWQATHLVLSAEADQTAGWIGGFAPEAASALRGVPYSALAVISLGLRTADAPGLPPGFGFLVPRGEGLRILGAIVNSNFLPGRAPAHCSALTVFVGGDLDPEGVALDDAALLETIHADLGRAIGWRGDPAMVHIERWPKAIPQYDMQHGERLAAIEAAEARWPGLHLLGNWRGGVSVGDRVECTHKLAEHLTAGGPPRG